MKRLNVASEQGLSMHSYIAIRRISALTIAATSRESKIYAGDFGCFQKYLPRRATNFLPPNLYASAESSCPDARFF